ncbi:MAG TPA: hypothetical protein VFZ02_10310 [Ktedonobacteraceae bacterium]
MAKTASDKPSAPAEEALKLQKKQARREAKLMLEIEEAKKQLKNAQKKQSKAQALVEARSTYAQSLEARLTELRVQSLEPEIETPPQSAEIEHQQELSEMESGFASSHKQQLASPEQEDQGEITSLTDLVIASPQVEGGTGIASSSSETGTSTSINEEQTPPFVEESTPLEIMVVTNEVTEEAAVQDNETAIETEPAPTTTPRKAPARKTAAARKPTATRRPASNTRSSRRSPSDAE